MSPPSASVLVTMNPTPAAPTISASGSSFCPGDSVILTSSSPSGNLWSDGETTQTIIVKTTSTYAVTDTQVGCPSPASAPVSVTQVPAPQPVITASQLGICADSSVTLDATTASASSYLWSTMATQPAIIITTAGFYQVTVTANGCTGTDTITIYALPSLGALSLPDTSSICSGDAVTLNATTANATSYLWSGLSTSTSPIITADSPGVYSVRVSNSCGTIIKTSVISEQDCECKLVMPNAFTPNGDGSNDMYGPDFKCDNPKYLLIRIFNRWGEKVYETTDLNGQWDGKYKGTMQPPEVYVYYVEFVGLQNNQEKSYKLMGSVTLIR